MVTTRAKRSIQESPLSKQPKQKSVKMADTTEAMKAAENDVEVKCQPKPDEKYDIDLVSRKAFLARTRECLHGILSGSLGWSTSSHEMEEGNETIGFLLANWIGSNVADGPEDAQLSRSQKHAIIKSLEGSCVQEDWDVLMQRLPELVRENILEVFLETLIWKDIRAKFFERPFWYYDGKTGPEDKAGDENFGQRLDYLYERFLETNPISAAVWKRETVRLSNSMHKLQAPNDKFGHYHKERRDGLTGQFVDDILSSKLIRWLLKPLDSEEAKDRQRKELIRIYGVIMELSISYNTAQGCLEFGHPDVLGQTFQVLSKTMVSHRYHFLRDDGETPDYRLDGNRVLLVVYPAMTQSRLRLDPLSESLGTKAYVVVEDPPEEQEAQPTQEPQEV